MRILQRFRRRHHRPTATHPSPTAAAVSPGSGTAEADSEMLVISMNFYDFKTGKAHIPDDILAGLADSMGTTPESIKTKRGRLLRKLEEYLDTKT